MHGTFAWHELMTTDPRAAEAFYTRVVGWEAKPWGTDGTYTLWMNGPKPVGGCMALPPDLESAGIPSNWLSYIGTSDVDATCAKAASLGATVGKAPIDIPDAGRIAVLADPAGALFGVYQPASPSGPDGRPAVGDFSWHELATSDPEGAMAFYGALFGWTPAGEFDMGPSGIYRLFGMSEDPMGGIYPKPAKTPMSNWLPYARVKQVDQTVANLKPLGGGLLSGPMNVPGGSRIAVAIDPHGAVFALQTVKH